ncbi:hypothetical protein K0M31_010985 [Melipona bicolor]|uniref:Uncharacterized protein n=1 Tax=Melipona bicolor TaxID=60889 RepID=A0AA40KHY1_9HYME|nr:hypothetical protein K0M31_010985 [Melipona bicolor]
MGYFVPVAPTEENAPVLGSSASACCHSYPHTYRPTFPWTVVALVTAFQRFLNSTPSLKELKS